MSEVVTWEAWLGQTKAGGVTDGIHLDFWDIMSICPFIELKVTYRIDRFYSSPLFCQEQAGHFGLVGIGIEQEADGHEGKD